MADAAGRRPIVYKESGIHHSRDAVRGARPDEDAMQHSGAATSVWSSRVSNFSYDEEITDR